MAYLLEKAGDIQGAFGIMRESLQNKIKGIEEAAEKGEGNNSYSRSIDILEIIEIMLSMSRTCQVVRFSCILLQKFFENTGIWFHP